MNVWVVARYRAGRRVTGSQLQSVLSRRVENEGTGDLPVNETWCETEACRAF